MMAIENCENNHFQYTAVIQAFTVVIIYGTTLVYMSL